MFTCSYMNKTFEFIHHLFISISLLGVMIFSKVSSQKAVRGEGKHCKLMVKSRDYFDGFKFFNNKLGKKLNQEFNLLTIIGTILDSTTKTTSQN